MGALYVKGVIFFPKEDLKIERVQITRLIPIYSNLTEYCKNLILPNKMWELVQIRLDILTEIEHLESEPDVRVRFQKIRKQEPTGRRTVLGFK